MKLSKSVACLAVGVAASFSGVQATARAALADGGAVPPSATSLLAAAEARAAQEHKNVLLVFHASWCIWCSRFDDLLNDPTLKPFWDDNFVTVEVHCFEKGAQAGLNNPGWKEMMTAYDATGQGVPYWLFLDPTGKILATCRSPFDSDSNGKPGNIGFPDASYPNDLTLFVGIVKASAPRYQASFEANLRTYLQSLKY